MRINPVYHKELKISVRTRKMAFIIFSYNLLLSLIGLFSFYLSFDDAMTYNYVNYSNILSIYTTIAVIEIGLVLFIVPGFTSSAISGERERQTLEILLTTKLKPMEIILGKLSASISSLILLVLSSLPVLSIVFAVGGIGILDLLQLMFLAIVTAIFIGSIGIFFSTVFKKTTLATIFTYGSVVFLVVGTAAIVLGIYLVLELNLRNQTSPEGVYLSPDVGNVILILLINPMVTMVAMVMDQFGNYIEFNELLGQYGQGYPFIVENWFVISIMIQLILSIGIIYWSAKLLDPLRKRRIVKKS